jgi:hypothetical protein
MLLIILTNALAELSDSQMLLTLFITFVLGFICGALFLASPPPPMRKP